MKDWGLTLGVLLLFALIFSGVNIGLLLLILGGIISIAVAIMDVIEKRRKRKHS